MPTRILNNTSTYASLPVQPPIQVVSCVPVRPTLITSTADHAHAASHRAVSAIVRRRVRNAIVLRTARPCAIHATRITTTIGAGAPLGNTTQASRAWKVVSSASLAAGMGMSNQSTQASDDCKAMSTVPLIVTELCATLKQNLHWYRFQTVIVKNSHSCHVI